MSMQETYRAKWGSDSICVTANWAEASSPIEGLPCRQVADFRHNPWDALAQALREAAQADGLDPDDEETAALLDEAMEDATCDDED